MRGIRLGLRRCALESLRWVIQDLGKPLVGDRDILAKIGGHSFLLLALLLGFGFLHLDLRLALLVGLTASRCSVERLNVVYWVALDLAILLGLLGFLFLLGRLFRFALCRVLLIILLDRLGCLFLLLLFGLKPQLRLLLLLCQLWLWLRPNDLKFLDGCNDRLLLLLCLNCHLLRVLRRPDR